MTRKTKSLALTIAVNACRLLLAVTFIFSGFVKANDPLGTVYKLEDYIHAMLWFNLPDTFLLGCAVILAFFEFTLGIYLLFGIKKRITAIIATAFMAVMTVLTIYIAIADPVSDCGCFGDVLILSNEATLAKNIVLVAAAIFITRFHRWQKDSLPSSVKWFIAFISLCAILGYAIYCIINLPVFDFRPFKVGTDLREAFAPSQQKYDVKIIYEKDGETLSLSAEDDDPDSTWTYVETRRIPLRTANLATTDFYVSNAQDEDITEDILGTDGYTLLLIIPNLMNADEGCIDKVNELYDYSRDKGINFYCLTSSTDPSSQTYWSEHTGAEYEYNFAEERMLKTVVRGQPGLVLLHEGIIVEKWSNYNMPGEEDFNTKYGAIFEKNEE